MFSLQFSLHVK